MTESKHTPGPWCLGVKGRTIHKRQSNGRPGKMVAEIETTLSAGKKFTELEVEANAHLIAAAPDLLEALEEAERVIRWAAQESKGKVKREIVGGWLHHADKARAAIAKARNTPHD